MKRALAGALVLSLSTLLSGDTSLAGDVKISPGVREHDVKGLSFRVEGGSAKKPIVIENEGDLAKKLDGAKDLQDKLQKSADFSKEYLLVFAWSGSGGDKIEYGTLLKTDDKTEAKFVYQPGLTRDLRQHLRVYGVTKGTTWSVETAAPKFKVKIVLP